MIRDMPHSTIRIDWNSKLRHALQTAVFCVAVAALQIAFAPHRPYGPPLVYSLLIGLTTWAVIDLGRHLLPSAGGDGLADRRLRRAAGGGGNRERLLRGQPARRRDQQRMFNPGHEATHDESHLRSGILITLLAGIVGSYWFYSRNKSSYLLDKMREAQQHATEARLKLLETQLEPHMLFNTLANLRALIAVDPARAQQMLDHMIAYLRATLDASRATVHPVQTEFDRVRDYLELMAIRMGPRLAFALELPPELADVKIPTLLLQPVVENSIQHGLEPKVEGGRIAVRASRDGGSLVLEVSDTGVGAATGALPTATASA
jgi:signal transduction histidine kinase